jgi:hypothetical protein
MLSVGIIGAAFLGNIQDRQIDRDLAARSPIVHERLFASEATHSSILGNYSSIDQDKAMALDEEGKAILKEVTAAAKKNALETVAVFPAIMLVCYLGLIFYFRAKGGYRVVKLDGSQ